MTSWRATVDIKSVMRENKEEDLAVMVEYVAQTLDTSPYFQTTNFSRLLRTAARTNSREAVDEVLERLYKYADEQRIWLGV